ncbi:hypothetical protein HYT53_01865 [Candidatus Woesearchaeota archaeon]|nr:hypothetical protein [Candidatus Woesearchaeota archaeon]
MQVQTLDKVLDRAGEISFDARYLELKYMDVKIVRVNPSQAVILKDDDTDRSKRILKPIIEGNERKEYDVLEYTAFIPSKKKARIVEAIFEILGASDSGAFLFRYRLKIENPNYKG